MEKISEPVSSGLITGEDPLGSARIERLQNKLAALNRVYVLTQHRTVESLEYSVCMADLASKIKRTERKIARERAVRAVLGRFATYFRFSI